MNRSQFEQWLNDKITIGAATDQELGEVYRRIQTAWRDEDHAPNESIEVAFSYHPARGGQTAYYEAVRAYLKQTAYKLESLTPVCPEQTIALRELQVVMFWCNAAIARHGHGV